MKQKLILASSIALLVLSATASADITTTQTNNGNLVMQDIPEIPASVVASLNRYQNVRSAGFLDWTEDGKGVFISTRFGDVSQVHHVSHPGGARQQITFFDEPVGGLQRQPGGSKMIFTMDAGGSEFSQIFLLDPGSTDDAIMLTDGESRNGSVVWDRMGEKIAYRSTRRNGASNDVWMMDVSNPETADIVLTSPDGTHWSASDFSEDNHKLLILNYVGNADSRIHLLDIASGELRLLAGNADNPSSNFPFAFDHEGTGFWFITDMKGDYRQLAWQSLEEGSEPVIVTENIPWNVEGGDISHDRKRGVFAVNVDGMSQVFLLDMINRDFTQVSVIPTGLARGMEFSPDDSKLGLTLNTAKTPSDSFVLNLGNGALEYGELKRWTYSEVGGLDTKNFVGPELVHYPTFDSANGGPEKIPAWVYKPEGQGPYPVIIAIHGGPEGQSRPSFSSTYQMWVDKLGAVVIRPNVRGSAGYGKYYMSLDNGFKREDSVKDIGALLDWITTQPDLDQNRVAVYGGSYGGYMVLACSVHYSDRLKAAVDVVGISNFVTFLENTQDYRRDLRRAEYGDERKPAMREHLQNISPLNHVEKIKIPMLVVQGQNDPRVPVTEAIQVVDALRAQGQPVWYMNALNEGHGYRKKENRDVYQQAAIMFLQEYLVGDSQ
ncbi:MAG: prolyl oligopeptidase family serine peptidase [Xanthomonadales bacterium]|nr:prolyl oligopeptidase family serine peptidase [Xanthomonadales bacterium]